MSCYSQLGLLSNAVHKNLLAPKVCPETLPFVLLIPMCPISCVPHFIVMSKAESAVLWRFDHVLV